MITNENDNTNWCQSVGGIVIKDDKVLLVRHTYGAGKGKLIIPGGYVNLGETPQGAVKREIFEETTIIAEPISIIGIRFNIKDWYIVFLMNYIEGTPTPDNNENSEAIFMEINSAISSSDVPDLTKVLLHSVLENKDNAFVSIPYISNATAGEYSLYGASYT